MKELFAKGDPAGSGARGESEVAKATADQKTRRQAKVANLSTAVVHFRTGLKAAPKGSKHSPFWARMARPTIWQVEMTSDQRLPTGDRVRNLIIRATTTTGNILGRTADRRSARGLHKCAELDPPNAAMAWRNFGISLYQAQRWWRPSSR